MKQFEDDISKDCIDDLLILLMHHSWFFSVAPLKIGIWETKSSQATVEIEFKFDTNIL